MGLVTRDSFKKILTLFLCLAKDCIILAFRYAKIANLFVRRSYQLTSLSYWENHLQLPITSNADVGFYPIAHQLVDSNNHESCSDKLYICTTYYHVFITLLKCFSNKEIVDIAVCNDIPTGGQLAKKLSQCGLFGKVFYINQAKLPSGEARNLIDAILVQHRRRAKQIRPLLPFQLSEYKDIYIFHDGTRIGKYLVDEKRKYHLIEDSLNFFKTLRVGAQAKNLHKRTWKYGIEKLLGIGYFPLGESKYLLDIEVNEKKDLQINHKYIIEVPRDHLKNDLSDGQRAVILDIFGCPSISINCNTALLLTEPLFRDRVVDNENQQIAIYQKIINELVKRNYEVIIKPHPRDRLNYQIFGCRVLSGMFPTEMFSIMNCPPFPLAATVTSSSLEQINAQNKIYFKELLGDPEILKI